MFVNEPVFDSEESSSLETRDCDDIALNSKPRIEKQQITQLKPHPRNEAIYGTEDVTELAERICQSGWVKSLVCTPDGNGTKLSRND